MLRTQIPREDRWMLCDETFASWLTEPVTPMRLRRLQREAALGGRYADLQLVRTRAYDKETDRLLRDMRAVEALNERTSA